MFDVKTDNFWIKLKFGNHLNIEVILMFQVFVKYGQYVYQKYISKNLQLFQSI